MSKVMIVGVGGQGTLLASRIIGNVAIKAGYDVKVSEVHGMSQRGGSVVTYVKYDKEVFSPLVFEGEADFLLAFEELEAYIDEKVTGVYTWYFVVMDPECQVTDPNGKADTYSKS